MSVEEHVLLPDVARAERDNRPARAPRMGRTAKGAMRLGQALPFVIPKGVLFAVFVGIPFFYTFYLTFQRGSLLTGFRFAGFDNYVSLVGDTLFRTTLMNTGMFVLILVPSTIIVTLALGLLLSSKIRGMGVYRSLIYGPCLLSVVATGITWKILIDGESGPLNLFFAKVLHINVPWLTDGPFTILFMCLITLWASAGFYGLIFMSAFNGVPTDLLEAARIDGANAWQLLTLIKLPLIAPVIRVVFVLVSVGAVQVFDLVFVMTKGGPGTATYTSMWYIYQNTFNGGSVPYAATMSVVLLIVTAGIALLFTGRPTKRGGTDD